MKKTWIIVLIVVVVAGAGGAAAFFFWDDLSLIFGGDSQGGAGTSSGGVDLVSEFEGEMKGGPQKNKPGPPAQPATSSTPAAGQSMSPAEGAAPTAQPPVEEVTATTPATSKADASASEEEGVDLGDEEEGGTAAKPSAAPIPPPPTTQSKAAELKKTEPVPTLARKKSEPAAVEPVEHPKRSAKPAAPVPATPDPSTLVQKKAQELIKRKKYADAERLMNQYLTANPSDGDVHFMLGFLFVQQNKKAMAIQHFQKAAKDAKAAHIRKMAEQYLQKLR